MSSHHLGSRTKKRHRDDRPDESTLYCIKTTQSCLLDVCLHEATAYTISKLFSAQRQHPHAEPDLSSGPTPSTHTSTPAQKSTLHSFWNISSRLSEAQIVPMDLDTGRSHSAMDVTACEDCDRSLFSPNAMDMGDGSALQEFECYGCRRQICDNCAVRGDQRVCLSCAMCR